MLGFFIEEKDFFIVWYYCCIDFQLGEKWVCEFCDVFLYFIVNDDLQVFEGNKVVEIKNVGVSKGKVIINWLEEGKWDFIMAFGDDYIDEDMFKVLLDIVYIIKVGLDKFVVCYNLFFVEDVCCFLGCFME